VATCSLGSTWRGDGQFRFTEASLYTGITRERWDAAAESLAEKKLLTRAWELTPEGRNARTAGDLGELQYRRSAPLRRALEGRDAID
jgi:hypothetical protein